MSSDNMGSEFTGGPPGVVSAGQGSDGKRALRPGKLRPRSEFLPGKSPAIEVPFLAGADTLFLLDKRTKANPGALESPSPTPLS